MMMFTNRSKNLLLLFIICLTATAVQAGQKVISLSPALTELICHLGKRETLVGRSSVCDYPAEVKQLPSAGNFAEAFVEKIIELKPDLVLANKIINPGAIQALRKHGIQVELMPCSTIREYRLCVEKTGLLLHAEKEAAKEISRIDEFLKHPLPRTNQKVLWIVWDSPILAAGANSLCDEVIHLAGAENIADNVRQPYFKSSPEWLMEHQADVILWTASKNGWKRDKFHKLQKAAADGNVIDQIDNNIIQRPGPRIFDGIRRLNRELLKLNR